jgi:predicted transport protein
LYTKKHPNKILYNLHLENAANWNNPWHIICLNIETTIQQKMKTKYDTLNNKIKKLKQNNETNTRNNNTTQHTFFKRTINMTDIEFTNDELHLLEKGLKYNLHKKPKDWIKTLALEADTAINNIPERNQPYMKQLVANNLLN